MKRFGTYDSDFSKLFECYAKVNPVIVENDLPSMVRSVASSPRKGLSFDGLKILKIYQNQRTGGATMTHVCDDVAVTSDDGESNVTMSGTNQDGNVIQVISSGDSTNVKLVLPTGKTVDFDTDTPLQYDGSEGALTIIDATSDTF